MNCISKHWLLLLLPPFVCTAASAHTSQLTLPQAAPGAGTENHGTAPRAQQLLFGSFPASTQSTEALKLVETSIDQYENLLLDDSVASARKAIEKDPNFALAYAVWSFAARRGQPSAEALHRAQALAPRTTAEEQLLIRWMTTLQQGDMLPAITAMNDLLARFPENKHILYLASEWLSLQQDTEHSRKLMVRTLNVDPNFPPVLNMLGYTSLESDEPDPETAIASLERYAALLPDQPNPQDSLGEILRYTGNDRGSLEHYAAALKLRPSFISSQIGLGDTSALMGDFARARTEYTKATALATSTRDRLHIQYQEALLNFWQGHQEEGRKALDALSVSARAEKEPNAQFEIDYARALLATSRTSELARLFDLAAFLRNPISGMIDADRNLFTASVLRERARVLSLLGQTKAAAENIALLEKFASRTRDLIIAGRYESARGYLSYARNDYANAVNQLSADVHDAQTALQLASAQEKLGDLAAAATTRDRAKYLRAPTVEWYLFTHSADPGANLTSKK